MKIVCKQSELLAAINIALRAVSTRTTMTILECIYINVSEGEISLTTNNMELAIETVVSGRIEEEGSVAINAKTFSEMIRKLPDELVTIFVDESYTVHINCGKAKFKIPSQQSGEDFPTLPDIVKDDSVSISQYSLKEIINQTIFAVSDNENTKIMTGEHFEISGNSLTVTALDGHRIAIRRIDMKGSYDPKDVVIPGKTLIEVSKILDGDIEKNVTIYFSDNNIMFETENTIILTRVIEGRYLNVKQMINSDYDTKVTIKKKELFDCIDRANLLVKESDKKPIIIGIKDGVMSLNMNTSLGSLEEEIEIEKDGKDILIGFNPKFIMDVIKVIDEEELTIYLTNAKAPCFIRNEDGSYNYLILPVNFTQVR